MRPTEQRVRCQMRQASRQRGAQVVELAIALPLLCFLAFLVTEAAAFVRVHQVINNAAREAARIASLQETNSTAVIETAARNYVTTYVPTSCSPNTDGGGTPAIAVAVDKAVEIDPGSAAKITGTRVTVTCNYDLMWVPPFVSAGGTIPLKGTAVFRNLY
ncbi:MAG TPA: TadE/TadG family type IV pilus assembly protein [Terriglobales bacterium]|nr:TadE/TadG family type IV pilus assembly protein [Terriglobales bacterium]